MNEAYFDRDRGIGVPKGMVGENQAQPGCPPVICWHMTMWAALVRQLEAFTKILHDVKVDLAGPTQPTFLFCARTCRVLTCGWLGMGWV